MQTQEQIAGAINAAKVGQTLRTLIDRAEEEYFVGRTEYDSPEVDGEVLIARNEHPDLVVGNFYPVEILSADTFDLYGRVH